MSLPRTQRRFARSRIEPGVSNLSINSPTLYQLRYRHRAEFQCADTLRTGVGGRGAGGALAPRLVKGVRISGKILGNFIYFGRFTSKFRAISYLLGNIASKFWAISCRVCLAKYSERWTEKPRVPTHLSTKNSLLFPYLNLLKTN